ncbi:MAG: thermonuclease family protein [Polyangiaceae bacterium]|nr:thermonuclease family protein [Polyangiaceae bacterium]
MDKGSKLFWLLISALMAASVLFGIGAERGRRAVQRAAGATLSTGDLVRLVTVVDGDTVVVAKGDDKATVRIVGIKSFPTDAGRDAAGGFGQAAVDALRRVLGDKPARVLMHDTKKDANGRHLATLFVDGEDVALRLVGEGAVLVYTVYPFPSMPTYSAAQDRARAASRGIWSNPAAAARADMLTREWLTEASP